MNAHTQQIMLASRRSFRLLASAMFLGLASGSWSPLSGGIPGPTIETADGVVAGTSVNDVDVFKGIPFAKAPVGELRWRSPQAVEPWKGVRQAVRFGANCMQSPPDYFQPDAQTRFDEDCLYLNVWKPARLGGKLPVLVWIHGGAFINGGTSNNIFNGNEFARRGVVFVSLNYRLGRLGFFAHPALSAAGEGPLGNYGYMDQIAALQWIKRNIAAFGGDPKRVTLMGESAGGISVVDLMVSPVARGLFQQAIVMSGGGRAAMANRPLRGDSDLMSAEQIGVNFAKTQGITGENSLALAKLRNLSASALVSDLNGRSLKINGEPRAGLTHVGGPIIDGTIKLDIVDREILRQGGVHMPVMVGTTSDDLAVPTGQDKDTLFSTFGAYAPAARRAYDPDNQRAVQLVRDDVTRDRLLTEPARFIARQVSRAGYPAFYYRFGYVPEAQQKIWKGVPHGGDVSFFFASLPSKFGSSVSAQDQAVASMMNAYVTNFVLHGDPNGPGLPVWRAQGEDPDGVMQIRSREQTGMADDPLRQQLDMIEATAGAPLVEGQSRDAL